MQKKCPVCSSPFEEERLAEHLIVAHPSYQPAEQEARRSLPHRCVFCGQSLATPEELKEHHRTSHAK